MSYIYLVLLLVNFLSHLPFHHVEGILQAENIIGGEEASVDQFKYVASLQANTELISPKHTCGVAIIDERFGLTAAHCIINQENNEFLDHEFSVLAGTIDASGNIHPGIRVWVEKVYIPKECNLVNPDRRNWWFKETADIAVIKFNKKLKCKNHPKLGQLNLPNKSQIKTYAGETAVIAGFGWEKIWLQEDPETGGIFRLSVNRHPKLKFAETTVISNDDCQRGRPWVIIDSYLCAHVKQRNPNVPEGMCVGDSGSPLVIDNTVIGILSSSPRKCSETIMPALYTRVSHYLEFIHQAKKDLYTPDIRSKTFDVSDK